MSTHVQAVIAPVFILLCILLGGSSSNAVWEVAALHSLAVVVIGITVASKPVGSPSQSARPLIAMVIAALVLILVQLIPLAPEWWKRLGGREPIALGFAALGYPAPWLPISWAPHKTLQSAYALLPPLAMLLTLLVLRAHSERSIATMIIVAALLSVALGALQIASLGPRASVYIYGYSNPGAVGFFANRNHMATLLLAAVPFSAALFAGAHPHLRNRTTAVGMAVLGAGGLLLILVGLILNGSLAALALAGPVVAFSTLLLPFGWRSRRFVIPIAVLAFVVSVAVLSTSWIRSDIVASAETDSLYSRGQIWGLTFRAMLETFPLGTGLGTFTAVYALQENPATVTVAWVNHAHNDYLELLLETGVPGLLLMIAFLAWYFAQAVRVWRSPFSSLFAKAATIAAAAILVHSIVDYPLRTAAIAAIFAACLGMMVQPPRQSRSDEARHIKIA